MPYSLALQAEAHGAAETPRFQCRHIFTDGHRCGSPALRKQDFCYYHHTARKPVPVGECRSRRRRQAAFALRVPEDRSAIQHNIGEVIQRLAGNGIDLRRAGLLLYALQTASLNLGKPGPAAQPADMVDEIVEHPSAGALAPVREYAAPGEQGGAAQRLLDVLDDEAALEREASAGPGSLTEPSEPEVRT